MDRVEQAHRVLGLVRLELADQVEPDVRMTLAQGRPLGLRLLHPVLAEIALPGGDQLLDRFRRLGLGDGDQGHLVGPPAGRGGGASDAGANALQPL